MPLNIESAMIIENKDEQGNPSFVWVGPKDGVVAVRRARIMEGKTLRAMFDEFSLVEVNATTGDDPDMRFFQSEPALYKGCPF